MFQHSEIVYADEIEYMDGSVASVFDPFVVTTYIGKHTIGCEVRMLGEDHGTGVVVPRRHVRSTGDLYVLHQEVMAKDLREHDVAYIDLEYHEFERFLSEH